MSTSSDKRERFRSYKVGCFIHYVWGGACQVITVAPSGNPPPSLNALADDFDVDAFAADMAAWGMEYVIFTAWHANLNTLFPSKAMASWGLSSHTSRRDLVGDVISALEAREIATILYTHPRDGHDLQEDDRRLVGWGSGSDGANPLMDQFDYKKWNDFTHDLYAEVMQRYGDRVLGIYVDEGCALGNSHRVVDYHRLRQTIKGQHPDVLMLQNYFGSVYTADIGDREYCRSGEFAHADGGTWPANRMPVGTCVGPTWWASIPRPEDAVIYSAEDMLRFTVLQAGVNTLGGGTQWAVGPYYGGGWENGVAEVMQRLADLMEPIGKAVRGVVASEAFPTRDGAYMNWVPWGAATDSPDGSRTYLHVLNTPEGRSLHVGVPANRTTFDRASLLVGGVELEWNCSPSGYVVSLPEGVHWDPLNTVIVLHRAKDAPSNPTH